MTTRFHLIKDPKKPWNKSKVGETGITLFPGIKGNRNLEILQLGGRSFDISSNMLNR